MHTEAPTNSSQAAAVSLDLERACERFLFHEAELLDDNRLHEWLALLCEDIVYEVPVRVTRERAAGAGFSEHGFHMWETFTSLRTRIERLDGEYAWAEDPPSRTRRLVGNVRVARDQADSELCVKSNLLLYRGRHDTPDHQLLAGERHDRLRDTAAGLRLARRTVLLDQTTLSMANLAIFL
jgi:3-phenylpropionate/cinnamic acid dioxygenase small subunit